MEESKKTVDTPKPAISAIVYKLSQCPNGYNQSTCPSSGEIGSSVIVSLARNGPMRFNISLNIDGEN